MRLHEVLYYSKDFQRLNWFVNQVNKQFKPKTCRESEMLICAEYVDNRNDLGFLVILNRNHPKANHINGAFNRFVEEQNRINPWGHVNDSYAVSLKEYCFAPGLMVDREYTVVSYNMRSVCLKTHKGLRWFDRRKFTEPFLALPF